MPQVDALVYCRSPTFFEELGVISVSCQFTSNIKLNSSQEWQLNVNMVANPNSNKLHLEVKSLKECLSNVLAA